jgi:hypothetical protein
VCQGELLPMWTATRFWRLPATSAGPQSQALLTVARAVLIRMRVCAGGLSAADVWGDTWPRASEARRTPAGAVRHWISAQTPRSATIRSASSRHLARPVNVQSTAVAICFWSPRERSRRVVRIQRVFAGVSRAHSNLAICRRARSMRGGILLGAVQPLLA